MHYTITTETTNPDNTKQNLTVKTGNTDDLVSFIVGNIREDDKETTFTVKRGKSA